MENIRKTPFRDYTAEDHRRRLQNIRYVEKNMTSCLARNMVNDYIPGQYVYQRTAPNTEEADRILFQKLKEGGVGLIQTWDSWYTPESRWQGADMYVPANPEETRRFIDLVHEYDLKIIPYTSTNFFNRNDDNFNPAWAYNHAYDLLVEETKFLAHCSPNSPEWRAHILRQYKNIMDNFEYDGVYIDTGYIRRGDFATCHRYYMPEPTLVKDDVVAFKEAPDYDGGMEDLLSLIYNEVKRKGGILKLHKEAVDTVYADRKIYDYLWVGEAVRDMEFARKSALHIKPYVVPDYNYKPEREEDRYLNAIPYMQFPVLRNGTIGIAASDAAGTDFDLALEWLKLYKEMATESAWCYVDTKADGIVRHQGGDVVKTFYVNEDVYLVVANYAKESAKITLMDDYVEVTIKGEKKIEKEFTLAGRDFKILKKLGSCAEAFGKEEYVELYQF